MSKLLCRIKAKWAFEKRKFCERIKDNSGQGAVDTAIVVLLSVVLGALILAGLYALIDGEVLPALSEKITEMFNYSN